MTKSTLKKILQALGFEKPSRVAEKIGKLTIHQALAENGLRDLTKELENIVPDISDQYSRQIEYTDYWKLKVRGQHAFQCSLMIKALESLPNKTITVVDVGDSAGTHMLYLKELAKEKFDIDTISVNLDPRAIEKIRAKGLRAILCRAERLDLGEERQIDLFTSFEMLEHLHNPAIFFRRLAKQSHYNKMLITVPYLKHSRVGLHHIRKQSDEIIFSEDEHIFELNPEDWTLLLLHSGWRVTHSEIYYQYPRKWPIISQIMAFYWRKVDFEGFWGAILQKDTSFSDRYQDWED